MVAVGTARNLPFEINRFRIHCPFEIDPSSKTTAPAWTAWTAWTAMNGE